MSIFTASTGRSSDAGSQQSTAFTEGRESRHSSKGGTESNFKMSKGDTSTIKTMPGPHPNSPDRYFNFLNRETGKHRVTAAPLWVSPHEWLSISWSRSTADPLYCLPAMHLLLLRTIGMSSLQLRHQAFLKSISHSFRRSTGGKRFKR